MGCNPWGRGRGHKGQQNGHDDDDDDNYDDADQIQTRMSPTTHATKNFCGKSTVVCIAPAKNAASDGYGHGVRAASDSYGHSRTAWQKGGGHECKRWDATYGVQPMWAPTWHKSGGQGCKRWGATYRAQPNLAPTWDNGGEQGPFSKSISKNLSMQALYRECCD